jgi:hypothetical protein
MQTISRPIFHLTYNMRYSIVLVAMALGISIVTLACSSQTGTFNAAGFTQTKYNYTVHAIKKDGSLLPDVWRLDNYHKKDRGGLVPKVGADYEAKCFVDIDGDGKDEYVGKTFIYDLRFTHKKNDGVIWLRTVPMATDLKEKELRILALSYIDAIAATHYEVVQLRGRLYGTNSEKAYATTIVEQTTGTVAKQQAYGVKFDVANVHQLQLSPESRVQRVLMIWIKTPFVMEKLRYVSEYEEGQVEYRLPVFMIAGYSNLVEDFDGSLGDFKEFISRISINGKLGAQFDVVKKKDEKLATKTEVSPRPQNEKVEHPAGEQEATSPKDVPETTGPIENAPPQ